MTSVCFRSHKAMVLPPVSAEIFQLIRFDWVQLRNTLKGLYFFRDHSKKIVKANIVPGCDLPSGENAAGFDDALIGFFWAHVREFMPRRFRKARGWEW